MVKRVLNISLAIKMLDLNLFVYFFHKSAHIEEKMSFLIKDDELLEKYNEIWEKVKYSIKKEFVSKPVYNKKMSLAQLFPRETTTIISK